MTMPEDEKHRVSLPLTLTRNNRERKKTERRCETNYLDVSKLSDQVLPGVTLAEQQFRFSFSSILK